MKPCILMWRQGYMCGVELASVSRATSNKEWVSLPCQRMWKMILKLYRYEASHQLTLPVGSVVLSHTLINPSLQLCTCPYNHKSGLDIILIIINFTVNNAAFCIFYRDLNVLGNFSLSSWVSNIWTFLQMMLLQWRTLTVNCLRVGSFPSGKAFHPEEP